MPFGNNNNHNEGVNGENGNEGNMVSKGVAHSDIPVNFGSQSGSGDSFTTLSV